MRKKLAVASSWLFAGSILSSLGVVFMVLNQDWFEDWGTPYALCMLFGFTGAATFVVGLVAFFFGQPKRWASAILGAGALFAGMLVFLSMMGGMNLFM